MILKMNWKVWTIFTYINVNYIPLKVGTNFQENSIFNLFQPFCMNDIFRRFLKVAFRMHKKLKVKLLKNQKIVLLYACIFFTKHI